MIMFKCSMLYFELTVKDVMLNSCGCSAAGVQAKVFKWKATCNSNVGTLVGPIKVNEPRVYNRC